jgi:hypothetical protein
MMLPKYSGTVIAAYSREQALTSLRPGKIQTRPVEIDQVDVGALAKPHDPWGHLLFLF